MTTPAGAGNRVVAGDTVTTWAELGAAPDDMPQAAAFLTANNLQAAHAVWAHVLDPGRETLIAARTRIGAEQEQELRQAGLAIVEGHDVTPALVDRPVENGRIWLLTSGSTGRPKQVAHTLASLTTVSGQQPPRTWLCPYATGAYAWWQVVTLSIGLAGQDIVFVEPSELDHWPEKANKYRVTAASGTPTFWRQALFRSGDTMAQLPLEQITLGGEPVDQAVLDQLRQVYPQARISWIYASSEAGAAIAVHDGRAGFPRAWLDQDTPGRPRLSVDGEELLIASQHAAEGMDAVIRTGDRVELTDDRVLITGRLASDEINVGGSKASAGKVRDTLLSHPDVAWASVRGRKAPLVGAMVVADVVLTDAATTTDQELVAYCAERLPDYSVPRRIRVLPQIPIKESLKSDV